MRIYFTPLHAQWLLGWPLNPSTHTHSPSLALPHLQAFDLGALVLQLGLQLANLGFLPADQRFLHHWLLLEFQLVLHRLELCGETVLFISRVSQTHLHAPTISMVLISIYSWYFQTLRVWFYFAIVAKFSRNHLSCSASVNNRRYVVVLFFLKEDVRGIYLFLLAWFWVPVNRCIFENQYKVIPTDHLYPMMKRFYPGGCVLFQEDPAPIHRAWRLTELFDQNASHVLWPSYYRRFWKWLLTKTLLVFPSISHPICAQVMEEAIIEQLHQCRPVSA